MNRYARHSGSPSAKDDHPDKKPDELYMGNTPVERNHPVWRGGFLASSWKTKRLGNTPLMADGTPYTGTDMRPWFIQISEVKEAVADAVRRGDKLGEIVFGRMLE